MTAVRLLIWGTVGYVLGVGVWVAARQFASPPEAQAVPDGPRSVLWTLRDAHGAISPGSVLTQAGMAVWGAYASWRAPALPQLVLALLLTGLLTVIILVDFRVRRIPNEMVLALLVLAAIQVAWSGQPTLASAALGLLVAGGIFLLLAILQRGAMGAGDVKLAAALGAVLGYPSILSGLFWGIMASGAAALVLLATRRAGRKDSMAYGPYLAMGAWIIWTRAWGLWP